MSVKTKWPRISGKRIWFLLRNKSVEDLPALGIGVGIIVGLNMLSIFFAKIAFFNYPQTGLWLGSISLGVALFAAGAFNRMHDGKAGTEWLLLPAEPHEKYIAAALEYALLMPIALTLLAMGLSALLALMQKLVGGPSFPVWLPGRSPLDLVESWAGWAVPALVFLAGSAAFKKIPFIKTAAVCTGYMVAVLLCMIIGFALFVRGRYEGFANFAFTERDITVLSAGTRQALDVAGKIAVFGLLPLLAISYGWAKIREKEARDEVQ